uniref:Uncharacterized protein AlNc14C46G3719 n=1 Tax=Albugo laibachii Nc14 TaxID=890382 RepID=F0WAJ5_9STRA|nr:conserved hypothetical protein [Albugo laibachii Nc14]|eukprot:CCA18166.1 conserved hypothetical protein [Albugo laibachii Nc14]
MNLSILLVILIGTVFTPLVTPFGSLYFYIHFWVTKYQFLYVVPHTNGTTEFAQTACEVVFWSLVVAQSMVAIALFQVADVALCVAIRLLIALTILFQIFRSHRSEHSHPSWLATQAKAKAQHSETAMYSDPYEIGLFLSRCWGVNKFREMETDSARMQVAFLRLKHKDACYCVDVVSV